jgi:DNA-binding XRE family transcriptional regulator
MNSYTKFRTPGGEEMIILARADYDRLVDAADRNADIAAADAVMRRVASGEDEFVPSDLVDAILAGENRVKAWRLYRGMTLDQLGKATGMSKSYLSQIENGRRAGAIDKLKLISAALKLTLDDLV